MRTKLLAFLNRALAAMTGGACIAFLGACESEPRPATHLTVQVTQIDRLENPVWHSVSADFDQDGDTDVFVHGHRGAEGDVIYSRDRDTFIRKGPVLKRENDRHACAAGDVNGDSLPDLYCTTGADRGEGINPNELWINQSGFSFRPAKAPFGAEEVAARGRLTAFMRFDNDNRPDLVTTVWGPRSDDQPNQSRVFRNRGGRFAAVQTHFGGRWGGRCLVVYDFNADGLDDLFACAEQQGANFFINDNAGDFEVRSALDADTWWWAAAVGLGSADDSPRLATIGLRSNRFFVLVKVIAPDSEPTLRRFPCAFDYPEEDESIFCGDLLLSDMDSDGHTDLYISRRRGWMLEPPKGDVEDLIVLGPHFDRYLAAPLGAHGVGAGASATEGGVLRLNAGENWGGSVDFVRLVERFE